MGTIIFGALKVRETRFAGLSLSAVALNDARLRLDTGLDALIAATGGETGRDFTPDEAAAFDEVLKLRNAALQAHALVRNARQLLRR